MDTNIRFSKCNFFYDKKYEYDQVTEKDIKYYLFQVEIPSSCHSLEDLRKSDDCFSRSQTSKGLTIIPSSSSSSQSDDFNHFAQGNPKEKQKLQISVSQKYPFKQRESLEYQFW